MLLPGRYSLLISSLEGPSVMRLALLPMLHHALHQQGMRRAVHVKRGNLLLDPLREDADKGLLLERLQRNITAIAEFRDS